MDTIKVVCAVIFNENKVLLCKRKKGKHLEGFWEFPGGKVKTHESNKNALLREIREELNLEVQILGHYTSSTHMYEDFCIKLIAYLCYFNHHNIPIKSQDHDEIKWTNLLEISHHKLAPADIPIARKLEKLIK